MRESMITCRREFISMWTSLIVHMREYGKAREKLKYELWPTKTPREDLMMRRNSLPRHSS